MKLRIVLLLLVIGQVVAAQVISKHHPKRILVKFADELVFNQASIERNTFDINQLDELNRKNGLKEIKSINNQTYTIEFENPKEINRTIYTYYNTGLFEYVEPDYIGYGGGEVVPNDGNYDRQWGLHNDGTFDLGPAAKAGADIDMQRAWGITTGSDKIVIAFLDTGLNLDHPEFEGRLWKSDDGRHGRDFANDDWNPLDDNGHGTNIGSILAANADNSNGFAGINWESKLMTLKILNRDNFGYYSWWASAIYFAADNGARVINMSVGGSGYSEIMEEAVNYATDKGCIIVACMMNENNNVAYYPAAYENTIAVGATNADDTRADAFPWNSSKGSNFGEHIDICAPGNYIYGLFPISDSNNGNYWSGTSQAAPHVAGVVSLLLALDEDLTLEAVRNLLTTSAEDQLGRASEDVEGFDQYHGHGRLNAYEALLALQATSTGDLQPSPKFKMSPNPISQGDRLSISFEDQADRTISIFDISGRQVVMSRTSEIYFSIDSANFVAGSYILKIEQKGKKLLTGKFIVK